MTNHWAEFATWFNVIQKRLFKASTIKGHHDRDLYDWETLDAFRLIGLMHTEISEAMQIVKRHGIKDLSPELKEKLEKEFADIVIRIMDFGGLHKLDIAQSIWEKADTNLKRPHQFGTPHSGETYNDE